MAYFQLWHVRWYASVNGLWKNYLGWKKRYISVQPHQKPFNLKYLSSVKYTNQFIQQRKVHLWRCIRGCEKQWKFEIFKSWKWYIRTQHTRISLFYSFLRWLTRSLDDWTSLLSSDVFFNFGTLYEKWALKNLKT